MAKTCIFCGNTRTFYIHDDYGNDNHTAKEDMLQFFGHQIEIHLRPDDAICITCMNIMDNVAKLKRRLLPLIFRQDTSDLKPVNLGKKWNAFASMKCDDDGETFLSSRSPTPSKLLTCKRVVDYETTIEHKIAEIERCRSYSRLSGVSALRSDDEMEIRRVFESGLMRRRKKRGHGWSRRKNGRYSRASSLCSVTPYGKKRGRKPKSKTPRSPSAMSFRSTDSYDTFYGSNYRLSPKIKLAVKNNLRYQDGVLLNKRTRSVSRQQEEESRTLLLFDEHLHTCTENDCSFMCENIDVMAQHKISRHKQLALYWCRRCGTKYTCSEDLEIHKKMHEDLFVCTICHQEFYSRDDLKNHWENTHWNNSVACSQCHKRFLDKNVRRKHMETVHKKSKPARVDYGKETESEEKSGDWAVRIMVQSNVVIEDPPEPIILPENDDTNVSLIQQILEPT